MTRAGFPTAAATQPDIVHDHDRLGRLPLVEAQARIDRMSGSQQLNVRADLDVVANRHRRHIQRHHTPVQEAARSDRGLIPAVAIERRADLATLTERSQQLGQERAICRRVIGLRYVELMDQPSRPGGLLGKLIGDV
jgi:hypothetical protein